MKPLTVSNRRARFSEKKFEISELMPLDGIIKGNRVSHEEFHRSVIR